MARSPAVSLFHTTLFPHLDFFSSSPAVVPAQASFPLPVTSRHLAGTLNGGFARDPFMAARQHGVGASMATSPGRSTQVVRTLSELRMAPSAHPRTGRDQKTNRTGTAWHGMAWGASGPFFVGVDSAAQPNDRNRWFSLHLPCDQLETRCST